MRDALNCIAHARRGGHLLPDSAFRLWGILWGLPFKTVPRFAPTVGMVFCVVTTHFTIVYHPCSALLSIGANVP